MADALSLCRFPHWGCHRAFMITHRCRFR
jgi:hypothetical protein